MNNTRVRELKGEATKTVSRKARKSGRASGTASPGGSDVLNKVFHNGNNDETASHPRSEASATPPGTPLRYYDSEDEGDDGPDPADLSFGGDDDGTGAAFDPRKLVSELQDRKPTHVETRRILLEHYVRMLRGRYNDELDDVDNVGELLGTFVRSADRAPDTHERSLSLQAYTLTLCLSPSADGGPWRASLGRILADDQDDEIKVAALQALTMSACGTDGDVLPDGSDDAILDYLDFLIDAVQANGESISATGRDTVMVALLESWAFAATHVESLWSQADYTMDALVEKLDSTDIDTQTAAAEAIALLFESSRAHEDREGHPYELPYDPARVATRIGDMTKGAAKSMSRRDRRDLRDGLRSVVTSLEHSVGPYYSLAQAQGDTTGEAVVGYRFKLRKRNVSSSYGYSAPVESWHHYFRAQMLRSIFAGGLERHIEHESPVVVDLLDGLDWSLVRKSDTKGATGGGNADFGFGDDDDY